MAYSRLEVPGTMIHGDESAYRAALAISSLRGSFSLFGSEDDVEAALGPVRGDLGELPTTATFQLLLKWSDADLSSGVMTLRDGMVKDFAPESKARFRELEQAKMADESNGLLVEASMAASMISLLAASRAEGGWIDDGAVNAGLRTLHRSALQRAMVPHHALADPGLRIRCALGGEAGCPTPINPDILASWVERGGLAR